MTTPYTLPEPIGYLSPGGKFYKTRLMAICNGEQLAEPLLTASGAALACSDSFAAGAASRDAEVEVLRADAESWRKYKARKDAVIAAGMGRNPLRGPAVYEHLRAAQAHAVMPLIGPLLDAWEGCSQNVRSEHPELDKQLRRINRTMEDAGTEAAIAAEGRT